MSVNRIDHVYVETRRFEETMSFWEALGFGVKETWGDDGHRACRLVADRACVVLAEVDPEGQPQRPTLHLGIGDAEETNERLNAHEAVKVLTPLEATHWGTRWIRVQDPDGNLHVLEG